MQKRQKQHYVELWKDLWQIELEVVQDRQILWIHIMILSIHEFFTQRGGVLFASLHKYKTTNYFPSSITHMNILSQIIHSRD